VWFDFFLTIWDGGSISLHLLGKVIKKGNYIRNSDCIFQITLNILKGY